MLFIKLFLDVLTLGVAVLVCFFFLGVVPYAMSLIKEEVEEYKKKRVGGGHHRVGMPNANGLAQELLKLKKLRILEEAGHQLAIARSEWVL